MIRRRNLKSYSKEDLKSSSSYNLLPCLKKQGNKILTNRENNLFTNQKYYDTDNLKNQLNICKTQFYLHNYNFHSLKIKYGKLYSENMANKNIISNILGIPLNKKLTKEQFLDKIENTKLNKYNREILKEAVDGIILKDQIKEKKEQKIQKENYLKELEENSKTKRLSELLKKFTEKCEEQRNLLRILKALQEKNNSFDNENQNLKEDIEKERNNKKEMMKKKEEKKDAYDKLIIELSEIRQENKNYDEKIKRYKLTNREKEDKNFQLEIGINDIKEGINDLESYKKERNDSLKQLDEKNKIVEELKKQRSEQETILKQLNQEKDNLDNKLNEYIIERPKLIRKAKEPKSDIDKMKKLEKLLEELKNKKIKINNIYEEKKKKLNDKKDEEKKESDKNKEIIQKNNLIKSELNDKINNLRNKNLQLMKAINNKYLEENNKYKNDNDKYQNEINEFDKELQDYNNIEEQLNNAESKLKKLMNKKGK